MLDHLRIPASLVDEVIAGLIVVAIALVTSGILRHLINGLRDSRRLAPIMARRLHGILRLTIFSIAILVLLQVFGVFGGAWAVISAGLAAVAVGFIAAWSMLSNATAALLILVFCPFRLGDTVELIETSGAGVGGRVVDINLMYTTLSVEPAEGQPPGDPQYLQIPNGLFFQKILRTRTPHEHGSQATFFSQKDH